MGDFTIYASSNEFPIGLKIFRENYKRRYGIDPGAHNMYVLESFDLDGNKTGEAYGINVMTNAGMTYCFDSSASSYGYLNQQKVYIGSGTTDPAPADTAIETPITTTAATRIENSNTRYPMEYDSSTDTITQSVYVYSGYFDYNISGITEDKEIHELGIGTSSTNLFTHAKVYDITAEGTTTPIMKKVNEKLVIKVFLSASYKVGTTISDLYDNGVYLVFEPSVFLEQTSYTNPLWTTYQRSYKGGQIENTESDLNIWPNNFLYHSSTVADNVASKNISAGDLLISENGAYLSKIVTLNNGVKSGTSTAHSYYKPNDNNRLLIIENRKGGVKLPDAEELTLDNVYTKATTDSSIYSPGMIYCDGSTVSQSMNITLTTGMGGLGVFSYIPVTQMDIKSCNMYNHDTKAWDISETVQNNASYDYDAEVWEYYGDLWMETPLGAKNVEVYVNMQTEYPITSISASVSGAVVYAADKYWDTSTWTLIDNILQIPEALQNKRYYISILGSSHITLRPNYNCTKHAIVPTIQSKDFSITGSVAGCKTLTNDALGYVVTYNSIVFPDGDTPVEYTLTGHGGSTYLSYLRWNTKDGSRILMLSYDSTKWTNEMLRVYTVTDSAKTPTFNDVTLTFTGSTDQSTNLRTFTSNGFYCSQNKSGKTCVILDVVGGDDGVPTQYELTNVQHCYAMDFTDNCVYLADDSDGLKFDIYDMRNKTVLTSFTIDSGYTFMGIVGWNNIVYVRTKASDGSYVTFSYVYETDMLGRVVDVDIPNMNVLYNANIRYALSNYYPLTSPDCMAIYQTNFTYSSNDINNQPRVLDRHEPIYVFSKSDPDNPTKVLSIDNGDYGRLIGNSGEVYSCFFTGIYQSEDNKHVYLYGSGTYRGNWFGDWNMTEPRVVDVGYVMDTKKPEPLYPCGRGKKYFSSSTNYRIGYNLPGVGIYKGQVLCQRFSDYSLSKNFSLLPIENFVPHKLVIETTTIQSYNNPKRIRNTRNHIYRVTNDLTKWTN